MGAGKLLQLVRNNQKQGLTSMITFTPKYHILSLSGGKDSTALAFFMKENMPEIFKKTELVFCNTGCELPETYDYLNKTEIFLNKKNHLAKTRKKL